MSDNSTDTRGGRLLRLVEPFVDLDIERVQSALVADILREKYERAINEELAHATGQEIIDRLVCMLAEIKTNIHLLNAAWLKDLRYKEPGFLDELPTLERVTPDKIEIDMRGEIVGAGWLDGDSEGRKGGPKVSIILPKPGPGCWFILLEIAEIKGSLDSLKLSINGEPSPFQLDKNAVPFFLGTKFMASENGDPFIAINLVQDGCLSDVREAIKMRKLILIKERH